MHNIASFIALFLRGGRTGLEENDFMLFFIYKNELIYTKQLCSFKAKTLCWRVVNFFFVKGQIGKLRRPYVSAATQLCSCSKVLSGFGLQAVVCQFLL